jgi:hypothetical protein
MMVAEDPGPVVPGRLMQGRPPDLGAACSVARHPEVAATHTLGGGAVAGLPGDSHTSRPPRMVAAALTWKTWPWQVSTLLIHDVIQT